MRLLILLFIVSIGRADAGQAAGSPQSVGVVDYKLGAGDVVTIQVTGVRAFNQRSRISNSGRLRVPYVGILFVSGVSTLELEQEIAKLIKEHELVNEPSVRVQVEEYRAQPAFVIGEVSAPGQFVITGEMYLLSLLAKAGGLLGSADETAFLYRRNSPQPVIRGRIITEKDRMAPGAEAAPPANESAAPAGPDQGRWTEEVLQINLKELRDGKRPEINVRLRGGDILYVPRMRAENIYVIGDVRVPGAYTLPRRAEITAAQAVIYAGGPMPTAKMSHGFLMRHDEAGERQVMSVDFDAIIKGRKPDIPVRANDIIFIPDSKIKTIGIGMLNLGPRLLQQFLIF